MPPPRALGSPDPKIVKSLKVVIMPVTVPKRPSKGAVAAVIQTIEIKRSNLGCSFIRTSSIDCSIRSRPCPIFFIPAITISDPAPDSFFASARAFCC